MSDRAARCAAQSDPAANRQFRRWPADATGDDVGRIRSWHADIDGPLVFRRPAKAEADDAWNQIIGGNEP